MDIEKQERRIYKHYQALRHQSRNGVCYGHNYNDDMLLLHLARHWKMSCAQIREIVRYFQRKNKENAT